MVVILLAFVSAFFPEAPRTKRKPKWMNGENSQDPYPGRLVPIGQCMRHCRDIIDVLVDWTSTAVGKIVSAVSKKARRMVKMPLILLVRTDICTRA